MQLTCILRTQLTFFVIIQYCLLSNDIIDTAKEIREDLS